MRTPDPSPRSLRDNYLNDVSCTAADACVAVGDYEYKNAVTQDYLTLILRWNGTTWSLEGARTPSRPSATPTT